MSSNSKLCTMLLAVSFLCLNGIDAGAQSGQAAPMSTDAVNSAVTAARAATKDKKYADAEALMLKVTSSQPEAVIPWVELGLAQIGLKKYAEAENDFKIALGADPKSVALAHANDFYQSVDGKNAAPSATRASRNTMGGEVSTGAKRPPEVEGVCHASLGEIYAKTGKIAESQTEFDAAVKAYPADTALYRRNQTIFYFQVGNADAQLDAATKAIAADPGRASNYYFKGQSLVGKATLDPKTQKMILPPGCAEAYQKYLALDPNGPYSADAKAILASAGLPATGKK